VYLGDSGAYFLGFMTAVLVVRLRPENLPAWEAILVAVLLLLLPLSDTAFVVVKRVISGTHPFTAGRDHLSHRLQERGSSVSMSVLQLQLIAIISTLAAIGLVVVAL
jgi:UDP-GlcNAc:undecaprenyl-phosphate GlcNAc-1-phosphate transferase